MNREPNQPSFSIRAPGATALLGLALAAGGIVAGLVLEGGRVTDVGQISAALIVFGGTLGALILTTPPALLASALRRLKTVFLAPDSCSLNERAETLLELTHLSRRKTIYALEDKLKFIEDGFFRKALMLAVDGTKPDALRHIMELEMNLEAADEETEAGVFEAAGGYAPTLGIIGAVLGLIQVMKHLDSLSQVGSGIAVAFVATVYGVGAANLLFLPIGQRIRLLSERTYRLNQLTLEGVLAIAENLHPLLIRSRLEPFLPKESRWDQTGSLPISSAPVPATRARAASA
jgi:chemotaxis protein MotA